MSSLRGELWTVCHLHSSSSFLRQWLWPRSHKHWSTHRASVCHGHAWCLIAVLLGSHIIAVRKLYPSKMKILWMNSGRPKLGGWHEWKEWRITWMLCYAMLCIYLLWYVFSTSLHLVNTNQSPNTGALANLAYHTNQHLKQTSIRGVTNAPNFYLITVWTAV